MSEVGKIIGEDKQQLSSDEAQIGVVGNVSYFELPRESIYVDPISIKEEKVYPNLGSTFILGHATAGVLGTDRLGYVESSRTRALESKIFEDFTESFDTTTYKDAVNTTADWDIVNGSLVFVSGSIAQSLNIGSDIQLSTTKINRMKVSLTGSNWFNTVGSVTSDGTNWFPVQYDIWRTLDSGSTGSEIMWKIVDSNQSASITQVDVNYKQDDF